MADSATPVSASPRTSRLRVRRNVRWLAAGVLAVALGGLGTWAVFSAAADTRPAIKITTTIFRGQVITAQDLAVVPIGRNTDVASVSGDQLNAVVGQTAKTDLAGGGLLVDGSFGPPELAKGVSRVGVKLDPGRIPSGALPPGTTVVVVPVPQTNATVDETDVESVEAVLASAPVRGPDGEYLFDLNVSDANAEVVARLAALGQVAIIQKSGA